MHAATGTGAMNVPPPIPRVILTYGRFDLLHQDHIRFLRQISHMGSELIVGCATDDYAAALGEPCHMEYEARRALLESCRFVSRVFAETDADQKRTDIVNYNASALAMGTEHAGQLDDLQDIAQVLYLPRATAGKRATRRMKKSKAAVFG